MKDDRRRRANMDGTALKRIPAFRDRPQVLPEGTATRAAQPASIHIHPPTTFPLDSLSLSLSLPTPSEARGPRAGGVGC